MLLPVSSDQAEEGADLVDGRCWLLERGEVASRGRLVPVADVGEPPLRLAVGGPLGFFG
jgi:hypothetical protein